jgi:hypothetical protein
MDALLQLKPLIRPGVKNANGTFQSERHFLDFIVNGQSLWEALGKRHDMVSVLCGEYPNDKTEKAISRLLVSEKADLPNDRRSFFVCSECGDLGCGAITAIVDRQGETITWRAFGYENSYEDKVQFGDYRTVGPFNFNATAYEQMLAQAMDRLRNAVK